MTFKQDLVDKIDEIASNNWAVSAGRVVPELRAIPLDNSGKTLQACVMYADLSGSTELVNRVKPTAAAEIYKAFLHCASQLITKNEGVIEAYDGDRVMGVFLGNDKESKAVTAAFQLKRAIESVVNPAFHRRYTDHQDIKYTVGIDTSDVLVCKAGVRGETDLIWIGSAPNYAAKLNSFSGLDHDYPLRVSQRVWESLDLGLKTFQQSGEGCWQGPYKNLDGLIHYRSLAILDLPT